MLGQTFSLLDIPRVGLLAFLEMILSADNAIVLGVVTSSLSDKERKKALYIGFISSFFFRAFGLLFIAYLFKYPWTELCGGVYLIYLSFRHFIKKRDKETLMPTPVRAFWKTIVMIELFDLAFAIDSIVAAIAFINTTSESIIFHPKLWIVYVGGMLGVFGIRYAAHFFSSLIHRFPRFETCAYLMIGWIGLKLSLVSLSLTFPYFDAIFWIGLFSLFFPGFITKKESHV